MSPHDAFDAYDAFERDPEFTTKDETRHRKRWAIVVSIMFFISTIFLLLINIGNVSKSPGLPPLYMFRLDVSNIIPDDVPFSGLINDLVHPLGRTLGLHDYYQAGMWNYCSGYHDDGIDECGKPRLLYWFNPVEIIEDEVLAGVDITLPEEIRNYLHTLRIASRIFFGCFFASTMTSFLLIFLAPLSLISKSLTIPISIFAILSTIATIIGAGVNTGTWIVFSRVVHRYEDEINLETDIGDGSRACQWIAVVFSIFGAAILTGLTCFGTSRRDVKTGRGRRIPKVPWKRKDVGEKQQKRQYQRSI